MKVNIVLPNHAKGIHGGYRVVFEYANYLAIKGHQVIIYYMMNDFAYRRHIPKPLIPLFGKYFEMTTPAWFPLDNCINKKSITKSTQIEAADVTVATDIRTVEMVYSLKNRSRGLIYFIQDYENWQAEKAYLNKSFSLGMKNITISKWLSKIADKYASEQSVCIPNGIDAEEFYVSRGLKRIPHSISFHYRSAPYKGCDIAIAVVEELYRKYPDLKVHVISSENNVKKLPNFCELHIRIKPREVAKIDNQILVFLCTSREEGYGLPGLEAMACGAALVSTDYLGVREYAIDYDKNYENGNSLLAPIDDVEGLTDRISRVFEDTNLRSCIVNNGLKTASQFTVEKSAEKFEKALLDLVNGHK